jgi:transcriptional regulator with XRE-family HTH domain
MASQFFHENDLGAVAKRCRLRTGKTKIEMAERLGVTRPSVQLAEENPEQRLISLRCRLIEACSDCRVEGPYYRLVKKPRRRPSGASR